MSKFNNIPWLETVGLPQNNLVAEELATVTGDNYRPEQHVLSLASMAETNGLEIDEARLILHNATALAMREYPDEKIARLTPQIVLPVISKSLTTTNLTASQHPVRLLDNGEIQGARQVPSIRWARGTYLNVRNQAFPIQDESDYIESLGFGDQAFQPYNYLFVEKVNFEDTLFRYRNPLETTLFASVRGTLQGVMQSMPGQNGKRPFFSLPWKK